VVEPVTSTVLVLVALVAGLVSLTTMVEPLTEVTAPEAPPNPPGRPPVRALPLPGGDVVRPVPPGDGVPEPPLAPPLKRPPPPPPKPAVQVPLVGVVMRTVAALIGVETVVVDVVGGGFVARPAAEVSNAEIHEPTVTAAKVAVSVWSNLVVDVKLTVVCPPAADEDAGAWTSIDCPVMEAMVPKAPGMAAGADEGVELDEDDFTALTADDPPPHAANIRAAPPKIAIMATRRCQPVEMEPPGAEVGLGGVVVVGCLMLVAPCSFIRLYRALWSGCRLVARDLFAPERIDGGQPGSPTGGVDPEGHTDGNGDGDRSGDGRPRDGNGIADEVGEDDRPG